jgi:hypothetical protein
MLQLQNLAKQKANIMQQNQSQINSTISLQTKIVHLQYVL